MHLRLTLNTAYDLAPDTLHPRHAGWADVVMPLTLADYDVMRANPLFRGKGLFPSLEAAEICADKQRFRDWFSTRFDPEYLPGQTGETACCIAKRRRGGWGVGSYLIENGERAALEAVRSDATMLLEDYVPGKREYAFHLLFDQGRALFAAKATYDHDRDYYVQGRDYHRPATDVAHVDQVPEIFLDILAALDYSGTACIDYKLDEHGRVKILEVNPRFGASLLRLAGSYAATYSEYVRSGMPRSQSA